MLTPMLTPMLKYACFAIIAQGLAQAVTDANPVNLIIVYGPMGAMLAWFMLRSERAMNTLSHRIDGMTRALLIDALSRPSTGVEARRHAQEMLSKIEARAERSR